MLSHLQALLITIKTVKEIQDRNLFFCFPSLPKRKIQTLYYVVCVIEETLLHFVRLNKACQTGVTG